MPDYLWMLPDLEGLGDEDEEIFEQNTGKNPKHQFSVEVESQHEARAFSALVTICVASPPPSLSSLDFKMLKFFSLFFMSQSPRPSVLSVFFSLLYSVFPILKIYLH